MARRQKRDSAVNLYNTCKQTGGDCPPDVVNKFEHTTWADTLTKWFASILYFGHLGIGTGKGTGGTTGYTPLNRGVNTSPSGGTRITRPVGPITSIGPIEPTIIDSTPTIIEEGTPIAEFPEVPVEAPPPTIDPSIVRPTDPSVVEPAGGEDIELDTFGTEDVRVETNETLDLPTSGVPSIDVTETSFTEITPRQNVGGRRVVATHFDSSTYTASVAEGAGVSVHNPFIVDSSISDIVVGAGPADIELESFADEFEDVSLLPKSSTPKETAARRPSARKGPRSFFYRFTKQFNTQGTSFLRANVGGTYEFRNPAYEGDLLTSEFEPDQIDMSRHVLARNLTDVQYAETPQGRVLAGRLGQAPGVNTRSGNQYGQYVHLFTEFSTIEALNNTDTTEMSTFNTNAGGNSNPITISSDSIVTVTSDLGGGVQDVELLPEDDYNFSDSRLRLLDAEEEELNTDDLRLLSPKKTFGIDVFEESEDAEIANVPTRVPIIPDTNTTVIIDYYFDIGGSMLDPSVLRKKRKRTFIF
ncbi:L1 [Tick-associated papillomavirus lsx]|nr:L1 [Tick-associated papillomavirus lsx]